VHTSGSRNDIRTVEVLRAGGAFSRQPLTIAVDDFFESPTAAEAYQLRDQ
jgi:hypothetical protein